MNVEFFMECVIGILAAAGLICFLKAVCDIIFTDYLRQGIEAELYLFADGTDPRTEDLLYAVEQIRTAYFPALKAIWIENGEHDTGYSYAAHLCQKYQTDYYE